MLQPCSPIGMTTPSITSSTSAVSSPERSRMAVSACITNSLGVISKRAIRAAAAARSTDVIVKIRLRS